VRRFASSFKRWQWAGKRHVAPPVGLMRELYIILSVVGWAWCLLVAAFLWVRLRKDARHRRDAAGPPLGRNSAAPGAEGTEEVRA
jgi:hypothetical protein